MSEYLPGTVIEAEVDRCGVSETVLGNIFTAGGLVMSQVSTLLGLEPYLIQNWVKRGFLAPPVKKQYTKRQFCRLCIINMLKDTLRLEKIAALISYVNGRLDDESDDMIGDDTLYNYYVDMCWLLKSSGKMADVAEIVTRGYTGPCEDSRERLKKVLTVMYYANKSAIAKQRAESILQSFDEE